MLRAATDIAGFQLCAGDDEIGRIQDIYFDVRRWQVGYFLVQAHSAAGGRTVLLSPTVISAPDWTRRAMSVAVTRSDVAQSAPYDPTRPVARVDELSLARPQGGPPSAEYASGNPPLQRVHSFLGSAVEASDGSAGKLADFLLDDLTWEFRYLVVETGSWWTGKKVLIAPQWVDHLDMGERRVLVRLARDAIKESPAFQPTEPVTPDYAGQLKV